MKQFLETTFNYTNRELDKIMKKMPFASVENLKQRLKEFDKILRLSKNQIRTLILKNTEILIYKTETIIEKKTQFKEKLGFTEEEFYKLLVKGKHILSNNSTENTFEKIDLFVKKLNLSQSETKQIVITQSSVFTYSKETIDKKLNILIKNNFGKEQILNPSFILSVPTDKLLIRIAICKHFKIPMTDFVIKKIYMVNENDLYSRLCFLKSKNICVEKFGKALVNFDERFSLKENIYQIYKLDEKSKEEMKLSYINYDDELNAIEV